MPEKNRLPGEIGARNLRAPISRAELDELLAGADRSDVCDFTRSWLSLDEDLEQLRKQSAHVGRVLGDRILQTLLDNRAEDLLDTMHRRATELSALSARQVADLACKCFVRTRLIELGGGRKDSGERLCDSIRKDVVALGLEDLLRGACT